jgi:hypothetical protein
MGRSHVSRYKDRDNTESTLKKTVKHLDFTFKCVLFGLSFRVTTVGLESRSRTDPLTVCVTLQTESVAGI